MRLELSASNRGAALDHDGPGLPELVTLFALSAGRHKSEYGVIEDGGRR